MAPFAFLTAGAKLWAKSVPVFSCTHTLTRWTSLLPGAYGSLVKCLTSEASRPPKRPLNMYARYIQQQWPIITRKHPEMKSKDIIRNIAQEWRTLSPGQKQVLNEAYVRDLEQFKMDSHLYMAQLSPEKVREQAEEKRMTKENRMAKKIIKSKYKEFKSLGIPKRPLSPLNIFLSEKFEEARGDTRVVTFQSLIKEWNNLLSDQKQIYVQLSEDDKIRYKTEMMNWENSMMETGWKVLGEKPRRARQPKPAVKGKP